VNFEFVSGNLALDFAGTRTCRLSADRTRELLVDCTDLVDWVSAADLIDQPVEVDSADLSAALAIREAVFRSAWSILDQGSVAAEDRRLLNQFGAVPPIRHRLLGDGGRVREGDCNSVLSTLSRSLIDLLGGPDRARLRRCDGENCTRMFVDRSRVGGRRWCGMATCGNRAKSSEYRRRHKGDAPT
jgi:predicted RNA-binding Zn ribbon-like protein